MRSRLPVRCVQFPIETSGRDRGMESPQWSIRGKVVKLFASGYCLLNICLIQTTDTFPFQESQGKAGEILILELFLCHHDSACS